MLVNKMLLNVIAILLVIFAIFLFSYYFSMFFTRRKKKIAIVIGYIIFVVWQLLLLNASTLPVYINIIITTTIYLWVIPLLPVRIYPSHYLNC